MNAAQMAKEWLRALEGLQPRKQAVDGGMETKPIV